MYILQHVKVSFILFLAGAKSIIVLVFLHYLLPDTRGKSDHSQVITFLQVCVQIYITAGPWLHVYGLNNNNHFKYLGWLSQ